MTLVEHIIACLSFDRETSSTACQAWVGLSEAQQLAFLDFADRQGLSLHLWSIAQERGVADRVVHAVEYRKRRYKNEIRLAKRRSVAAELNRILSNAGLRFAFWKGFFMAPNFVSTPEDRQQNDIDLLLSPEDARRAFDLLQEHGYKPLKEAQDDPDVHLPMLFPENFVDRQGDYYNPLTDPPVELHDRLWPSEFERIPITFKPDPLRRLAYDDELPVLGSMDHLAACTLHAVRHMFRGNLRISHLWEIAGFVENHSGDNAFWRAWMTEVNLPLRQLCTTEMLLAAHVFRSRWPATLDQEQALLPASVHKWINRFGVSVLDPSRTDKPQIFLQLAFISSWRDKLMILQRRLVPLRIPASDVPYEISDSARNAARLSLLRRRAVFHLVAFFKFLRAAVEFWF